VSKLNVVVTLSACILGPVATNADRKAFADAVEDILAARWKRAPEIESVSVKVDVADKMLRPVRMCPAWGIQSDGADSMTAKLGIAFAVESAISDVWHALYENKP
jgi:hypothetical protein